MFSVRLFILHFLLQFFFSSAQQNARCGEGTSYDINTETCRCDGSGCLIQNNSSNKIYLGGLVDLTGFPWAEELLNATIDMINNPNDGWWDSLPSLNEGATIEYRLIDSACEPKIAARSYWELKTNWGKPLHAIMGCRCSGASQAVAQVAGLEYIPQVSPSSTASLLSDVEAYPSFFRAVAPDDSRGQVGALVALLRHFGWDRVSVIGTDTLYTRGLATEFGRAWVGQHQATPKSKAWTGEVAYSHTITLTDGAVDDASAIQALEGVPTEKPTINSRIIILMVHQDDAFRILEIANRRNFQPDTVWIATDGWSNHLPPETAKLPQIPGCIGITPFDNSEAPEYTDYLKRLQSYQRALGREVMTELPTYGAQLVDATLSLLIALTAVGASQRSNGTAVVTSLQQLTFDGVSGFFEFTKEGHRANPQYTIVNMNSERSWIPIGSAGLTPNSVKVDYTKLCWADKGCGLQTPVSDKYPVPPDSIPLWVMIVIPAIGILVMALAMKYWRSKRKKKVLKSNINDMQKKLDAMSNIDDELDDLNKQVERAKERQASLLLKREELQEVPPTWKDDTTDILVEVPASDEQYWAVFDKLKSTVRNGWISKVWRIQNKPLWTYYSFHKNRLEMNGIDHNERSVWHGTSSLDPSMVYNDRQDGFMMQFSSVGFWGRGIYFADKGAYSHYYAHTPNAENTERPGHIEGEREMFLAKLLVGNEIVMDRDESPAKATECRELTVPPTDFSTGLKYNTVTGYTGGSQVWVVYENGRAYPDYLIRYYKGKRDPKRTPYATKEKAIKKNPSKINFRANCDGDLEVGVETVPTTPKEVVTWEYFDQMWHPYDTANQKQIEDAFQEFTNNSGAECISVKSGDFTYEVNFRAQKQTNIDLPTRTTRKIRRNVAEST